MLEKSFLAHSYKCCILVLSAVTGHLGFLGIASLFLQSTQRPRIRIYFIAVHDGKQQPNPNQLPTEWFQVAIVYPLIGFQVLRSDGSSETRGLNRFESAWTPFRSFSQGQYFQVHDVLLMHCGFNGSSKCSKYRPHEMTHFLVFITL